MAEFTHWAVYQVAMPIFGIGTSPEEAISDAKQWASNPGEPFELSDDHTVAGNLCLARCSKALAEKVARDGGDIAYDTTADYRNVFLRLEEEADEQ